MARRAASRSRSRSLGRGGRDGRYDDRSRNYRPDREADWARGDERRGSYRDDRDTREDERRGSYRDDRDARGDERRGSYRDDRDARRDERRGSYRDDRDARGDDRRGSYRDDRDARGDDRRGSYRDDRDADRGGGRGNSRASGGPPRRYPSRNRSRSCGQWGGRERDDGGRYGRYASPQRSYVRYASPPRSNGRYGSPPRSYARYASPPRSNGRYASTPRSYGRYPNPPPSPNPPWRRGDPSPPVRRDREDYRPQDRSPHRDASLRGSQRYGSPVRRKDPSPRPASPARQEEDNSGAPPNKENPEGGSEGNGYFGAAVVDGVPRSDKRPTWRAEIYMPRPGAPLVHRDRGSVCIRGPNRFNRDEAEDDLEQCKQMAEQSGEDAAKQVRALASRLKTDFERKKHVESGHAGKD